ncbi:MAG: TonB-dependent receptor [Bacteroidaceae bacterium]|nr:TonB-dependent receptor [Bacteroidaceae bacterium]
MKRFLCTAALTLGLQSVGAQSDSLNVTLGEASVIASRATSKTPIAFTNISAKELERSNFGVDLPYLISQTPSCVATSDAGAGIGYTSLRIRGVDATRTNVTINDVPLNDAESHSVFWVNTPDLASSVKDIQIQRGVGTSTHGAGAFGASLNLRTDRFSYQPYAELQGSYGSFNTHKETVRFGTGLMNKHWTFDGRLSHIGSDGYIDRAESDLYSFYTQAAYYAEETSLRFIAFGGNEETYHAWNYASREEMEQYGRRYNSCGLMYTDAEGRQHFYEDQTDNYKLFNYQFLVDHRFNNHWSMNVGLHYTKGDGYYQEYKTGRKLLEYGMQPYMLDGEVVKKSDLVRKKAHDSHFGGGVFSLRYKKDALNATLGGGYNYYRNDHFGRVLWVKNYIGMLNPNDDYYRNKGEKNDANIYAKAEYALTDALSAYADVQYRHLRYQIGGENDKYDSYNGGGMQMLNIDETFNFVNPKAGVNWQVSKPLRLFASVAMAHKEPTRNNYTDGYFTEHPKEEKLIDYELGAHYQGKNWHVGANLYYMDYTDQLVLTGELNEIGEAVSANVPESYRAGLELQAGIKFPFGLSWDANATFSRNRIKNYQETIYGYDDDWNDLPAQIIQHGTTHIAFSPEVILGNALSYEHKDFFARLSTQYVGEQYMSNADVKAHQLDAYCVSNLDLAYTFHPASLFKSVTLGVTVYNLFNETYENNGWASSSYLNTPNQRVNYTGYAAQAGTNFLAHVTLKM